MFDLVPFAGARRKLADGDGNAEGIGQCLQFYFPQSDTVSVAAPAIGGNQEALALG